MAQRDKAEEALAAVEALKSQVAVTNLRMDQLESAGKDVHQQLQKMDSTMDAIHKMLSAWNLEIVDTGSAQIPCQQTPKKPEPAAAAAASPSLLTEEELLLLKKQEAAGKIKLFPDPYIQQSFGAPGQSSSGLGFPQLQNKDKVSKDQPDPPLKPTAVPAVTNTMHDAMNWTPPSSNCFSLSIARPKLDFPTFSGDNPVGWLRQCEKYFLLANVPLDIWVSLATLHCHGIAENWWRSLRTPSGFMAWSTFSQLVLDRFSPVSHFNVVEQFQQTRPVTSVHDYIIKFEENMSIMQRVHPQLTETYYVMAFVAGLKDNIKHYLIPHSPITLTDCYWRAKELEKGVLARKFPSSATPFFQKSTPGQTATKPPYQQPNNVSGAQPLLKREPGKCWGYGEPWTPQHRAMCKFRKAVNAMAIDPENWLVMEQQMEEENTFEDAIGEPMADSNLMMLSAHAASGKSTAETFSLSVQIGGKQAIALVDTGSTDTFIDSSFASKS